MALVTKPPALDESMNTTEQTPRNVADVLAQELSGIATAISGDSDKAPKTDIATVEPTNGASRAYSVGELVYVNGKLYKVIKAIASEATFTVGTNIQSANVSGALSLLNNITSSSVKSNTCIKRFISTSLSPQITLNISNMAMFFITNMHWHIGDAYSLTFFQLTSQSEGSVYKSVLVGNDIYTLTKDDATHYTISDNSDYPGGVEEIVIDLMGTITNISDPI